MPKNRKDAEAFIISYIHKISPDSNNKTIYEKLFKEMDDTQFDSFMEDLKSGKKFLVIITSSFSNKSITVNNNLKIAEELNHNFFEKLWIEGKDDLPTYLTPVPYLVVDLPVKRASQLLTKGISVPDHTRIVDSITGQPTGDSKGAKISYPEAQICAAMGLTDSLTELMKYRGGDNNGLNAFNTMISRTGSANLRTLSNYSSGVESTKSLKTFLTACHLKTTI